MADEASPSGAMALAGDFPARTREDWLHLVAGVLNKTRAEDHRLTGEQAEDALRTIVPGGLVIDPLYLRSEHPYRIGVPGHMPFTRGRAIRPAGHPWDVRQLHDDPDASTTRAAVRADLERGVSSIWVHVGSDGIASKDLELALSDVLFDLAPVAVSSWDDQQGAAAALIAAIDAAEGRGEGGGRGQAAAAGSDSEAPRQAIGGNLGHDPIGAAARTGSSPDLGPLADAVRACLERSGLTAITVDTRPVHDAGADDVDEVGFALATGLAYLRHLEAEGIGPAAAFGQIEFRVAVTQDQFLAAAKLRALRRAWARIGQTLEVPEEQRGAHIHAVTGLRMFTRDDPWVNVLRCTLAVFGASIGGADAITVLPFDSVAGLPTTFSRRLARNTQLLLAQESNVGAVTDPGGGSWYLEELTDDVARGAWGVLQETETAGGIAAMLADGSLAARLDAAHQERAEAVANRRIPLTGISMFPLPQEAPLERTHRSVLPQHPGALPARRDSAAYEELRDRARRLGKPTVTVATVGTQRDFGAREGFVTNLLAAGGISVTADVRPTAILASSTKGYAAHARQAVEALRAGGATRILVAGRARELGQDASLVDGEVKDGMDVVAFLSDLLTELGAPPPEAPASTKGASA